MVSTACSMLAAAPANFDVEVATRHPVQFSQRILECGNAGLRLVVAFGDRHQDSDTLSVLRRYAPKGCRPNRRGDAEPYDEVAAAQLTCAVLESLRQLACARPLRKRSDAGLVHLSES